MLFRTSIASACMLVAACDRVFGVPAPSTNTPVDGSESGEPDALVTDPAIVARYHFESIDVIADETTLHDGRGNGLVAAPGVIGSAIEFPSAMPAPHVLVNDASDWDLPEGAIELWVRPVATPSELGILSRDSSGTVDGHFVLMQLENFFVVRIQRSTDAGGGSMFLCSNQAPNPGTWMHIGINLGEPAAELYVDDTLGTRTDSFTVFGGVIGVCNAREGRSIIGNNDPWVFGALAVQSDPGTTSVLSHPFAGGAIDELIVWRTRRMFGD